MKPLLILLLASTSAHAINMDIIESGKLPAPPAYVTPLSAEDDAICTKFVKKQRRAVVWSAVAVGFAAGLGSSSTSSSTIRFSDGTKATATSTYRDPYKAARAREQSNAVLSDVTVARRRLIVAAGCDVSTEFNRKSF